MTFTPVLATPPGAGQQGTAKEEGKKESLVDDNVFKELMDKGGLTNDVNSFVEELIQLEQSSDNPFLNNSTRVTALRMIGRVNELKQSKAQWQEALDHAKSVDSIGEVAVGSYGEVYTKDQDNNIKAISLSEFNKNRDSIKLMSVGELMYERQHNPRLVNQNSIFNIANDSIGLSKITNHIKGIISAFGVEEDSETRVYSKEQTLKELGKFTGKTPTSEEAQAVKRLQDLINTPGEFYKVKTENSSERRQALKAVQYIWNTLGDPAQKKLTATAAINGVNDPREFILDMISVQTDEKRNLEITPTTDRDGDGSGSGDKGQKSLTQFQMFFKNSLKGVWTDFMVNDPNVGSLFKGAVGSKGPLVDKNDNPIGMSKLSDVLSGHQYNSMVDTSNMYFGDKKISPEDLNNVIYNNAEDAGIIFVPVKSDGSPDYDSFERFNQANQVFEANKSVWSDEQIKNHFKRYNFQVNITTSDDGNKSIKALAESANVKPFLVMSAYTNDAVENIVDDNGRLSKMSSSEVKQLEPYFESIWTIGQGKSSQNLTPRNPFYKFGTPYYKGVILAPLKLEASVVADALAGQGPTHRVSTLDNVKHNIKNSNQQLTGGLNPITSSAVI